MKLKICVVSSTVFKLGNGGLGGYGGLEQIAWLCAKGLAEKGHEVSLISPNDSECLGVTIIPAGPERQIDEKRSYSSWWPRLLEFDVVIDHSWSKFSYILKAEGKLKAPILGVFHAPVNTQISSLPPNVQHPCFVCISEDQKNHFEALFSPAKAKVAYNGVSTSYYAPIEGIKRSDRFLFLARFSRIKGALIALKACLEAGVGLDLIGDEKITNEPEYLAECKALAEQSSPNWDHSKGKQLRLIGGVTRAECVWWFSQACALLHSAKEFREPFGLAPVEAMLCECPVLAFDNGACRETIKDSITGRIVSTYEEYIQSIRYCAFKDPIYDNRVVDVWRSNCREWAKKFSIENMTSRYEELCYEALNLGGW